MGLFEVLDGRRAAQVEEVLAHADVPSTVLFTSRDVSQRMLHGDALAEHGAPRRGLLQLAELVLLRLVPGDRNATSFAAGRLRAVGTKRAGPAYLWIEVDGLAGLERFHLACGACDGLRAKIDAKVGLRERARLDGAQRPWLREHGAAFVLHGERGANTPDRR